MKKLTEMEKLLKPKKRKTDKRIKKIFKIAQERVVKGEKPKIKELMIQEGYSESSARCLKIIRTDAWKDCIAQVPADFIAQGFVDLAQQNDDKRTKLSALVELSKLKDLYPGKRLTIEDENRKSRYFEADEAEIIETED